MSSSDGRNSSEDPDTPRGGEADSLPDRGFDGDASSIVSGVDDEDVDIPRVPSSENSTFSNSKNVAENDQYKEVIDKLYMQISESQSGEHPSIAAEEAKLLKVKKRQEAAAEKYKERLIANIRELNDYEMKDLEVQMQVQVRQAQDDLLDQLHQEARRVKRLAKFEPKAEESVGGEGVRKKRIGSARPASCPNKRPRLYMPVGEDRGAKVTVESVLAKMELDRVRTTTLSDFEVRKDFQKIIDDWRKRTTAYLSNYSNSDWTKVVVNSNSLKVHGDRIVTYQTGDAVVVTSRVTEEQFLGEITLIKPTLVYLSLHGGVTTRIWVDHITNGRLLIEKAPSFF